MRTRMVVPGVLWLANVVALEAGEPPKTPATDPKPQAAAAKLEPDAKKLGLGVAELKRLREFGFTDSEILDQTSGKKRTARQVITEREVINDLVRIVAEVNVRVSRFPAKQQPAEREALLKDALAKVRRDHRTSREEMRRILAGTNFLSSAELDRVLGTSFFGVDGLKSVIFNAEEEKH